MVMVRATQDSEAGVMPDERLLNEMGKFNEELVKAGVMLAGEGLHPTSKGVRVRFTGGKPAVTSGPFPKSKDLVAGFWLWKVNSMDEAIDWLKQAPFENAEVEIRQLFESEDFAASDPTGEHRRKEAHLRETIASRRREDAA
jgi:hypothetical protein